MPRLFGNIPWVRRVFSLGARPDTRPEARPEGVYEGGVNMRLNSIDGNNQSAESIQGEVIRFRPSFPEQPISGSYTCIGACTVTGAEVSFWASVNGIVAPQAFPPIVKINGVTMASSPLIPYRYDRPLQFGNVSRCVGGVIYPADHHSDPLYWDIPAIIAAFNSGSQQYLSLFSLDYVSVALATPSEWPEFTGLVNMGGGAGLAPGQYSYWLRYVTSQGDRTNNGPPTPLISVPRFNPPVYAPIGPGQSPAANQYPGGQITGGPANPDEQVPTTYGIALRFLVDNRQDYDEVEVVRQRFNDGQGLNGAGTVEVIARLPIFPGEFGYRDLVDPRDQNFYEEIPNDEAQREGVAITAPKGVEYTDNRVTYANFNIKNRVANLVFRVNALGQKIVAITQRVSTWYGGQQYDDGHADAVNGTYLKGAMHNERYTLGLQFWDGESSRSPVAAIEDNFLFPGRRDRKTGDSADFSSDPIYAANDECQGPDPVSQTFDAFSQGQIGKETTNADGVGFVNASPAFGAYNPWTPIGPSDTDATRYRFSPVSRVDAGSGLTPIAGRVWSPSIHALGALIYGPDNLDTAAPWAKVMGVVVSPPAGRVVAEGLITYKLNSGGTLDNPVRTKASNEAIGFFPDISSAVVSQSLALDIEANPQNYRVRLTPLGFYSEVYGRYNDVSSLGNNVSRGFDILSFAGVQYDNGGGPNPQWAVNVGETPGTMGYQPGASAPIQPTNYVGPGKWRRLTSDPLSGNPPDQNYSIFADSSNPAQGGFLFTMQTFQAYTEGRGRNYRIVFNERPYTLDGQQSDTAFNNNDTRQFHEPVYVAHIIRVGAVVPELNVQQYRTTGNYIVVASEGRCIGVAQASTPADETTYELFHARKEDCVGRTPNDYRYAYIQKFGLPEQRYVCVTGNSFVSANLPAISADIAANGFWTSPDDGLPVHGIYRYVDQFSVSDVPEDAHPKGYLRFGGYAGFPVPPQDSRICVKYDKRAPIRAFGFDTTTAPNVFAAYDRALQIADSDGSAIMDTCILNGAPLPYGRWERSSGYQMLRTGATIAPPVSLFGVSYRQWVLMWHGVTRTQMNMSIGSGTPPAEKFPFPRTHYVMRPYRNGYNGVMYSQYYIDYPDEDQEFQLGGFRFWTDHNLDYSKQPLITGLGEPRNGLGPRLDYCNAIIVSERKDPQTIDRPGLRTFYFENIYPISEENGEIKMIHVLDQGGQQNLWAIAEQGACYIPYNKSMLTDADGDLIATQSTGRFWPRPGGERWVSRGERGCPDQFWRFSVKANAAIGQGDADTIFWADRVGVYRLSGSQVVDIARGKNLVNLYPILQSIPKDYSGSYAGEYNYRNGEVWMRLNDDVKVFSAINDEWVGAFTFAYDQYLSYNGQMIGFRELSGWDLDTGQTMFDPLLGPQPVQCSITTAFFPSVGAYKEAMRFRIVGTKPDYIELLDADKNFLCRMDAISGGVRWVKLYDGWEGFISRVSATVNANRPLPQGEGFYLRAGWTSLGPKQITAMDMQIKNLY